MALRRTQGEFKKAERRFCNRLKRNDLATL